MTKHFLFRSILLITFVSVLFSCKKESEAQEETDTDTPTEVTTKSAAAVIGSKSGSTLTGDAIFLEEDGKVTLTLTLENATEGSHAAHLHQNGDCSSDDGKSAGGHWNPTEHDHGKWGEGQFHKGDIGNVEVGADGKGSLTLTTDLWAIGGDDPTKNIIGTAVIVHAKADDFQTQPTGNAGGREGCGVVEEITE